MRFFPLQNGIYNPTVSKNWTREFKNSKKPYIITDKGDYGKVSTKWRPEYKRKLIEVEFDLKRHTWMLYDFREYPILGLYNLWNFIDFKVEDRNYRLDPDEVVVLDAFDRPALFGFPKGTYTLYLLPYLGFEIHRNYFYFKATSQAVDIIREVIQTNNPTIWEMYDQIQQETEDQIF